MDAASLVLTIVSALAGIAAALAAWLGWRSAKRTEAATTERAFVDWAVDRHSDGTFELRNAGHDPAYDVTVEMWTEHEHERVEAPVVPPQNQTNEQTEPLLVVLSRREQEGPDEPWMPPLFPRPPGFEPPPDPLRERMRQNAIDSQVGVRVVWRSKLGRWSTWTSETG